MNKSNFKIFLLIASFFVLSNIVCASSQPEEHVEKPKNLSLTPMSKLIDVELSIYNHLEKELGFSQYICEEINVNGIPHHLSPVPGDNDCGPHAINAQYPNLNLTREGILKTFSEIIENPENPFYKIVTLELASSLVSELRKAAIDSVEKTVLLKSDLFYQACTKDCFSDRRPYVLEASGKLEILKSYIAFLKNKNVMLLDISETIDLDRENGYMGTFGLVCQIYKCSIDLVNYSKIGEMPVYSFHFDSQEIKPKKILFRSLHFSPLCEMTNEEERRRLAQHHIQNVLIPRVSIYQHASIGPVSGGHIYADDRTIDAQIAQAMRESLLSAQQYQETPSFVSQEPEAPLNMVQGTRHASSSQVVEEEDSKRSSANMQERKRLQDKIEFWSRQAPSALRELHIDTWSDLLKKIQ